MPDQNSHSLPDRSSSQPDLMAALEKSLDRPTWVIHLAKHTGPLTSRSETWVGVADDREAANAAALAWVQDSGYYVSYADGPFVSVRERDRLRAENERLNAILGEFCATPDPVGRSCGECFGCNLLRAAKNTVQKRSLENDDTRLKENDRG